MNVSSPETQTETVEDSNLDFKKNKYCNEKM